MQHTLARRRYLPWAIAAGAAIFLLRHVLWALAVQLSAAYLLMALALPLCRHLERHLPPGMAAALAQGALAGLGLLLVMGVVPPLAQQLRQLGEALPALMDDMQSMVSRAQSFLHQHGLDLAPVRDALLAPVSQWASTLFSGVAQAATRVVQSAGKLVLAPLLAFYLLRDRQRITTWMMLLIPVAFRTRAVRAAREMRRETVSFLRGQLLLSLAVGALTAIGLMVVGTPGALALGLLMGVMELIPYIGPVLAGIPAVLLALQGGLTPALWTLGVLVVVQQVESSFLSPRLLSGATRLHPLLVLLTISSGGMLAGIPGMILALPAVVCARGAIRSLRM